MLKLLNIVSRPPTLELKIPRDSRAAGRDTSNYSRALYHQPLCPEPLRIRRYQRELARRLALAGRR